MADKILYIIRGVPGSGKSTLAHKLSPIVVEADDFMMVDGEYKYDPKKVHYCHKKCFETVKNHLKNGEPIVAVANTFIKKSLYVPYVDLANEYGYKVIIRKADGNYQNVHNVPADVVNTMRKRFQECMNEVTENDDKNYYMDAMVGNDSLPMAKLPSNGNEHTGLLNETLKKVSDESYVMEITSYNDIKPFIKRYCSFGARGVLNTNNNKVYLADSMALTHGDMVDDLIKNGEQIDYDSIIRFMVYPTYETAIDSEYGEYWNNNEDNRIDFLTNKDLYVLFKQYSFMNDRLNKILKLDTMEDVEKDENVELISEAVNQHSLYHGCDLAYAVSMMIDNAMRGETIANINGKKYQGNSLTRSLQFAKDWQEERWDGHSDVLNQFWVVLELNKERLKTKYKVLPYNYWEDYFGKDYEHTIDRNGYGNQYEEFVVGRINNLRNYLDDVYLSPECFDVEYAKIFAIVKRELELRGENFSDSDIDKALQTLGIDKPSPNDFDGEYLNESIVHAERSNDYYDDSEYQDMTNVILKNPSRKELIDNGMIECRIVKDWNDNFYFANSYEMIHTDIVDKLESENITSVETNLFYDTNSNTFYYNVGHLTDDEIKDFSEREENELRHSSYISKTFKDFHFKIIFGEL